MSMKRLILLPFLAFCLFAEGGFSSYAQSHNDTQIYFDALHTTGTILSSVQRYFVDTIDLPTIHALGMNAMLSRLDPYTEYMTPKGNRPRGQGSNPETVYSGLMGRATPAPLRPKLAMR